MDILAERLDEKLREWKPNTAAQVRQRVVVSRYDSDSPRAFHVIGRVSANQINAITDDGS